MTSNTNDYFDLRLSLTVVEQVTHGRWYHLQDV